MTVIMTVKEINETLRKLLVIENFSATKSETNNHLTEIVRYFTDFFFSAKDERSKSNYQNNVDLWKAATL